MILLLSLELLVESVASEDLLHCATTQQHLVLLYQVMHLLVLLSRLETHVSRVVVAVASEG